MQNKLKVIFTLALVSVMALSASSCDKNNTAAVEQRMTEKNQQTLLTNQPPKQLTWSLEREQINKRTDLWNNPNKVSYIYLVDFGKVMAFYTIKGKVSSVNSQITNPDQIQRRFSGGNSHVISSPAEDGSYGTNGDAIFFFTTAGIYVEWAGRYMLADQPLKMSTPPALVYTVDKT